MTSPGKRMKLLLVAVAILLPAAALAQERPLSSELNRALTESEKRCGRDSDCNGRAFTVYAKASQEDINCRRANKDPRAYETCSESAARDALTKIAAVMPSSAQTKK